MKREIKFRAWHKTQKRMFPVYGLGEDFVTEDTMDGTDPDQNSFSGDEMNDIEIMQSTGLKDKNGDKIYEGDILSDWPGSNYEVFFHENGFWVIDKTNPYPITSVMGDIKYMIIGNIHENRELLKQKQ